MGESLTARRKRPADTLLYGLVYFCAFLSVALLALILIMWWSGAWAASIGSF